MKSMEKPSQHRRVPLGKTVTPAILVFLLCASVSAEAQTDPLPSWNDGQSKRSILKFVAEVTREGGPNFVPTAERIATFDNDGTLWTEQPMFPELRFAIDRVKVLLPKHPEWQAQRLFRAVLNNDNEVLAAAGAQGIGKILTVTHTGLSTEEFAQLVRDWLITARHPRLQRPYTELVFQPMLELLSYLRTNGFKTFVVSGGEIGFLRVWVEPIYGILPEQVVGSSVKTRFEIRDSKPVLIRLPLFDFIDDKGGKPVGIDKFIGRRPIAAFGNSDGDQQMLEWTTAGAGLRFGLIVHHTDAEREYAYDRRTLFGHLDKALDEARQRGWIIVDMKQDWKVIYPFEKRQ
jgi:phosphoserine phosphatase